jgi:hypothetical protein
LVLFSFDTKDQCNYSVYNNFHFLFPDHICIRWMT